MGQDFRRVCRKQKIRLKTSAPYTPQENGKIERLWGTITPMARCMIFDANLSKTYWPYALNMAANLKNMCFHSAIGKTPYESMYGEKPNLNFVKTFGCVAYSFVEKQFRKKLDKNSRRGIFLGTSENSKAYLIGIQSEGKLKVQKTRNVSFDESKFYFEKKIEIDEGERVGDVVFFGEVLENIPKSAKEALADPDWQEAMKKEFDSLEKNKIWELVRNRGEKPIGSRWHFALKYGPNGEISRFKARFVAKGFSQVGGRDFHETYSPTAKMSTIRIVLSLAVQNRYQLRQLDIKTAYLNAKLDEEILMKQPEGFEKFDEEGKPLVCLLKKSLYGLKQSGRSWHRTLKSYLEELGFENSVFDECLFVRRIEGEIEGLICLWVDDIVVCGADKNFGSWFERNISEKFEISEISDLKWFLGMKIDYSGNEIRISQEKYVEKLISRFKMTEAKPITTPIGENEKLTKEDCPLEGSIEQENMKKCDYRGLVGCLNYLALSSRPDICFAANFLSSFVENPGEKHWKAGKIVLDIC